jgi:hypothetical protein
MAVISSGDFSPGNIRIEVKHASVHLTGLDPLGAVKSGVIRLFGIIRQGIRTRMQRPMGPLAHSTSLITKSNFFLLSADGKIDKRTGYLFTPDTSNFTSSIRKLWFLNITPELGLALLNKPSANPVSSKSTYERVGFIELTKREKAARVDKLKNSPRRLIYII